ncbi:MAG: fasciclin domain-containing protein [Saprospiraceae bacterium]|nr:fasciclin domain-containing protein [Saprospiraceae bacterium]
MKKLNLLLLLLLSGLTLSLVSCNDDDDDEPDTSTLTIAEIALDDDQFSTLVSALDRVDLTAVLQGDGPFTVFAPTNSAFDALGVDLNALSDAQLTNILLYHVLGGNVTSSDLQEGKTYSSTASTGGYGGTSPSLLIEKSGSDVILNGDINVTQADIDASNGTIHVIDNVLLPMDVVGIATSNSDFSQLVDALGSASGDLVSVLSGDGPFTVFAPLNSAFQEISGTVAGLDADQLASVLTYHVVSGNVRSEDLTDGMSVTTIQTEQFTVSIGNDVTITDSNGNVATVVLTDVQGTNGVVHVINKVILPENL